MSKRSSKPTPGPNTRITPCLRRAFQQELTDWFAAHRRILPWRSRRTPYRVWISELMLQQTRVDQAGPYFDRFMKKFPDLAALARAPQDEVLKAWEGLGYYARARRAHQTAQFLVAERGGKFPRDYDGLLALPGVGPYTAAAIASLAYGLDHAVLDGNVIRVLARVFAVEASTDLPAVRGAMQETLGRLLPAGRAADFNEAMMELGALVCVPRQPRCHDCPLRNVCAARRMGEAERFPVRKVKPKIPHRHVGAGVIIDRRGRILIARRKEASMLGGLWEFPGGGMEEGETIPDCIRRELNEELGIETRIGPHLITVRHVFSHFSMDLHAHWVRVERGRPKALGCDSWKWVTLEEIAEHALPRADQKIYAALKKAKEWPAF
jgi:A/G-specific adenine glycosylase